METCHGDGAIVGSVIGTLVFTLIVLGLVHFTWKRRKAKENPLRDLVLVESGPQEKGYENLAFKDELDGHKSQNEQPVNGKDAKRPEKEEQGHDPSRKPSWANFGFLLGHSKDTVTSSTTTLTPPMDYSVHLKGHDFTGLGFSIEGGPSGIYIKEVMQRGPAAESEQMKAGDRIRSLSVSFDGVVLPDAVALMGYASPYALRLDLSRRVESVVTVTTTPAVKGVLPEVQEIVSKERGSPVALEMESIQMKSPDILDLRPTPVVIPIESKTVPNCSTVHEQRAASPKITCAEIPDHLVHHMIVTTKELYVEAPGPIQIPVESMKPVPKDETDTMPPVGVGTEIKPKSIDTPDRAPSADSTSSARSKFHIRLFHKSKQYDLEPEIGPDGYQGDGPGEEKLRMRKMDDAEVEGIRSDSPSSMAPVPTDKEPSLVSKGLKSLKELKDKVSQRLSAHDSTTSNSDSDENKPPRSDKGLKKKGKSSMATESNKDDQQSSDDEEDKPTKPKRSNKRKAPVPPDQTAVEVHTFSIPVGTAETKRCVSYGQLPSSPVYQENRIERASSLDLSPKVEGQITSLSGITDLSRVTGSMPIPHVSDGHVPTPLHHSSSSSSSETLRDTRDDEPVLILELKSVPKHEIERVATETIDDVFRQAEERLEIVESKKKQSRIPVPSKCGGTNGTETDPKGKPSLLRDDSKQRLMQTVADANDIKGPSGRSGTTVSPSLTGKTMELSPRELDGVMMSHAEFLARQDPPLPLPGGHPGPAGGQQSNDTSTSFDTWIYVDETLQRKSAEEHNSNRI